MSAHTKKLPPDPEGQNEDRAAWALAAIKAFQEATGTDDCDAVADLLADLRHLCDRKPEFGPYDVAGVRGLMHYEAETMPEDETEAATA